MSEPMTEERLTELERTVTESMGRAAGDTAFAEILVELRRLQAELENLKAELKEVQIEFQTFEMYGETNDW